MTIVEKNGKINLYVGCHSHTGPTLGPDYETSITAGKCGSAFISGNSVDLTEADFELL